jgi:hypothetical protein
MFLQMQQGFNRLIGRNSGTAAVAPDKAAAGRALNAAKALFDSAIGQTTLFCESHFTWLQPHEVTILVRVTSESPMTENKTTYQPDYFISSIYHLFLATFYGTSYVFHVATTAISYMTGLNGFNQKPLFDDLPATLTIDSVSVCNTAKLTADVFSKTYEIANSSFMNFSRECQLSYAYFPIKFKSLSWTSIFENHTVQAAVCFIASLAFRVEGIFYQILSIAVDNTIKDSAFEQREQISTSLAKSIQQATKKRNQYWNAALQAWATTQTR